MAALDCSQAETVSEADSQGQSQSPSPSPSLRSVERSEKCRWTSTCMYFFVCVAIELK